MANSKYEYVRGFERDEFLLPNTWIVIRIDGRGFHKLSSHYNFTKPNDKRALDLMNAAAVEVVKNVADLILAYGVSDEYSFLFHRSTSLFERRTAKLTSTIVSTFTAYYVRLWSRFFDGQELDLRWMPTFDGRAVCYPTIANLRDYLSWRQVDCHINNLYNTTFWTMVSTGGMSATAAEEELKGTVASDKNEILFSRFGINYNNEPDMFKKGSAVFREFALDSNSGDPDGLDTIDDDHTFEMVAGNVATSKTQADKMRKARAKAEVTVSHLDIIRDSFWIARPWILSGRPGRPVASVQQALE